MARTSPVTLQINVAPVDLPHATDILPHQMRAWGSQVQEILFTFDLHRTPRGGHFGEGWDERRTPMRELLEQLCREQPDARIAEVDYAPERMQSLADDFTAGSPIPAKDTKGAPFYPYLYGLHEARHDLVFHLDSDLIFGGASQTWIDEARTLLAGHGDVLACSPLPGPPTADGSLHRETAPRFDHSSPAYVFKTLSTRLFMIDRQRLRERVLPLRLLGPIRPVSGAKARLHGNPPYRAAELSISEAMSAAGLYRVRPARRRTGHVVSASALSFGGLLPRPSGADRADRERRHPRRPARRLRTERQHVRLVARAPSQQGATAVGVTRELLRQRSPLGDLRLAGR